MGRVKRDPILAREGHLRRKFGITIEQYNELLEQQGGVCAICFKTPEEEGVNLAVDHNHKTGEVRGILCRYCNHRLVGRHTDADLVQRIADYLRRSTGWFIPDQKKRRRKTPRKVKASSG